MFPNPAFRQAKKFYGGLPWIGSIDGRFYMCNVFFGPHRQKRRAGHRRYASRLVVHPSISAKPLHAEATRVRKYVRGNEGDASMLKMTQQFASSFTPI